MGDVLDGDDPQRAVLHNCLLIAGAGMAYGRDAILELLRARPSATPTHFLQSPHAAALFATLDGKPIALFADRWNERLSRLWYLADTPLISQPGGRVDVPFDHGFGAGDGPAFEAELHPDLASEHGARVTAILQQFDPSILESTIRSVGTVSLSQPRINVLRALSQGGTLALLLMVTALRNDGTPALLQFPMAALTESDSTHEILWVADLARLKSDLGRPWQPALS